MSEKRDFTGTKIVAGPVRVRDMALGTAGGAIAGSIAGTIAGGIIGGVARDKQTAMIAASMLSSAGTLAGGIIGEHIAAERRAGRKIDITDSAVSQLGGYGRGLVEGVAGAAVGGGLGLALGHIINKGYGEVASGLAVGGVLSSVGAIHGLLRGNANGYNRAYNSGVKVAGLKEIGSAISGGLNHAAGKVGEVGGSIIGGFTSKIVKDTGGEFANTTTKAMHDVNSTAEEIVKKHTDRIIAIAKANAPRAAIGVAGLAGLGVATAAARHALKSHFANKALRAGEESALRIIKAKQAGKNTVAILGHKFNKNTLLSSGSVLAGTGAIAAEEGLSGKR